MLDKLSSSLKDTLKKLTRLVFIDERAINELVKELQRALLQADVNVQLVFNLTKKIKERALNEKPLKNITQREFIINIVYEELTNFLGKEKSELIIERKKPFKIMMVGLFGSGKTTSCAKIAKYYKKRNYKIGMIQLDVYRPASYQQLVQLGDSIKVPVFGNEKEKDPLKIYKKFESEYKNYDILIIDTAGRDALSSDLIKEIELLNKEINPDEKILVISADIGQAAQQQAEQFHKSCNISSIIVTKMDGTAKAGGALSACSVTGAKIKFIGIGEKVDALETFNPPGFVSRLLGMGDIEALLEKAKEAITEEQAKDLGNKFLKGEFNLIDLYEQMEAMSKMGPISKVLEMVPGFSQIKLPKDALQVQEGKLKKWRFILDSLTKKELEDPEIIDSSRIERIAKGAGVPTSEVRDLLKQYKQAKKLMKMMKGSPDKMMKKFKFPGMK